MVVDNVEYSGRWNANEVTVDDIFRANYLFLEEMTADVETQKNGIVSILDFSGFGFSHVRHFSPYDAQRMAQVIQVKFHSYHANISVFACF